jgi:Ca-activated chloride channel homolog
VGAMLRAVRRRTPFLWLMVIAITMLPRRPSAGIQGPQRDSPVYRSEIALVSLNVAVKDHTNRPVRELIADDFAVFEDSVSQPIVSVSPQRIPLGLALLLDTSASMDGKLGLAQLAASEFVQRMAPDDQAAVIDFDNRVQVLQPFTNNVAALQAAINRTAAGGSTALFNALYIALKDLEKVRANTPEEIRRQAIVVLTDGEDTSSLVPFEDVLDLAKRSHTSIYAIGLHSKEPGSSPRPSDGDFVLRRLTQETGGLAYFPNLAEDLPRIYREVADELATQYLVAYTPTNNARDGKWRRLNVRINRPDCLARTRTGYYAPSH